VSGPAISPKRPELVTDGVPSTRPRWLELAMSTDHKDVGRMMIAAALGFLALGLLEFILLRAQLMVPENGLIEPVTFNRLLSVMGPSLVMLFALPLALGLFAYLVPLQIGARQLAFPRLANFSFWLYVIGGAVLYVSFIYTPPEAGINPLPPLSDTAFISNNGVDVWVTAVGMSALGFLLLALNLIVTIRKMRAPGLAWRRLPPFTFSAAVSSWVLLVACPAMLAGLTMLEIDRHFDGVFFDPGQGGAPTYWQHLSWIFFTGCYLVMVLPAAGAISEIIATFSRKPLINGLDAEHVHGLDTGGLALLRDGRRGSAAGPIRAPVRQLARDPGGGRDRAEGGDAVRAGSDLEPVDRPGRRARPRRDPGELAAG
jgi:heme/copper-type cytochrome/quinol oxidase subunit 1